MVLGIVVAVGSLSAVAAVAGGAGVGVSKADPPRLTQVVEHAEAIGTIGVADGHGRFRGTMPYPVDYAKFNGVIPVSDEDGNVVGYVAERLGFLERDLVEVPGFDLRRLLDEHAAALQADPATQQQLERARQAAASSFGSR